MLQSHLGRSLQIVGISVDCIDPCKPRLKYYVRSSYTFFSSVNIIISLDDEVHDVKAQNGLETLRKLWELVFGLEDDFSLNENLSSKEHKTAGVLYSFELRL